MTAGRTVIAVGVVLLAGCRSGPEWVHAPHDTYFTREAQPARHTPIEGDWSSEAVFSLEGSVVRPLGDVVSPGTLVPPPPALDVNDFGHVHDSTWFTNRITRRPLTAREIRTGPDTISGPAPGPLEVISGKVEGVTPGFVVRDRQGVRFLVKLDHPAYPALSSGAEIIATKILHAAGYNVPQNFVVTFHLDQLRLSPAATTRGRYDKRVPLTREGLDGILSNANPYPDGTIRALFSRIIEGRAIGPFAFEGLRDDDPNDVVPHQRRRSLRGLRWIYAWLNNTDPRASNTLDVFIDDPETPERGFVKHYLLDFGDALGASGTEPKYLAEGYENLIDLPALGLGLFTFGINYRYWLPVQRTPLRSVGTFESDVFTPKRWRPAVPNPAFVETDPDDTLWAALLISRFTPELLGAAVDTAGYTESGARDHVLATLIRRQTKILEFAFEGYLPLDDLVVRDWKVGLTDRAVASDLIDADQVRYRYVVRLGGAPEDEPPLDAGTKSTPWADLEPGVRRARATARFNRCPYVVVEWVREDAWGSESAPFRLRVRVGPEGLLPVGFERVRR